MTEYQFWYKWLLPAFLLVFLTFFLTQKLILFLISNEPRNSFSWALNFNTFAFFRYFLLLYQELFFHVYCYIYQLVRHIADGSSFFFFFSSSLSRIFRVNDYVLPSEEIHNKNQWERKISLILWEWLAFSVLARAKDFFYTVKSASDITDKFF